MILRTGIRAISDLIVACGYDQFYEFGSLTPALIGEHEIVSLFWRDFSYAQLVVRGDVPKDLFKRVTIDLGGRPLVLEYPRIVSLTAHGDTCWQFRVPNPGQHGGDFAVEIS